LIYPYNGKSIVGEWKNGKEWKTKHRTKNGRLIWKFEMGKNGQGMSTSLYGEKYVGEWMNGKPNGQGTLTFPDGTKGIGEFREGRPWNITHRDKNGNIIVKFVNGKQIKP